MDAGAFQPHAFVAGDKNERLTVGCVARAYPEDDNRQKQNRTFLSSATTRFASLARAELDAFRRERDRDEFPNESCHRASHDAWVAFRGADFFSKELEKEDADADGEIGSFVVSVAEGSSAPLLERRRAPTRVSAKPRIFKSFNSELVELDVFSLVFSLLRR